jgi:ATP-dependent helicase HrpB
LAARAAAERIAALRGDKVGQTVGYRMRGATKVSADTRIEVVTEGILTRMLQSDPELSGIGTLIFDEFHERSLNADLGLALAWEARGALRPDLNILVMSATLDAAPVAALLDDAPIITAQGRSHPIDTRWLDRPLPAGHRFEDAAADLIARALKETAGGVLAFLPGAGEIARVASKLEPSLPENTHLHRLFGAIAARAQRAAIAPEQARKLVLATSIAETSLTIPDISTVVDCGRSRRARYDAGAGMARLVTERVSRAEADQRRGRAGRTAPGIAYRMWARAEEGALPAFAPPEIENADLAALALELAVWGAAPADLGFLTPPPMTALCRAQELLQDLGALDRQSQVTDHGRALAALPLHPRLGHMLTRAGPRAAGLAALLGDRDPLPNAGSVDVSARLSAIKTGQGAPALARLRDEARRLEKRAPARPDTAPTPGEMAALAFPDRIGQRRKGSDARYVLSGGKGGSPRANCARFTATASPGRKRWNGRAGGRGSRRGGAKNWVR